MRWKNEKYNQILYLYGLTTYILLLSACNDVEHLMKIPEMGFVSGASHEKQPSFNPEIGTTQEGKRRKRFIAEVDDEDEMKTLRDQLIEAFERNGKLLSSQLESQNIHLQLDREQRKDQANNLISVLHKLADALGRIADKL